MKKLFSIIIVVIPLIVCGNSEKTEDNKPIEEEKPHFTHLAQDLLKGNVKSVVKTNYGVSGHLTREWIKQDIESRETKTYDENGMLIITMFENFSDGDKSTNMTKYNYDKDGMPSGSTTKTDKGLVWKDVYKWHGDNFYSIYSYLPGEDTTDETNFQNHLSYIINEEFKPVKMVMQRGGKYDIHSNIRYHDDTVYIEQTEKIKGIEATKYRLVLERDKHGNPLQEVEASVPFFEVMVDNYAEYEYEYYD